MLKWFKAHIKQIFAYLGIAFVLLPLVIIPITAQGSYSWTTVVNSGQAYNDVYFGVYADYGDGAYCKVPIYDIADMNSELANVNGENYMINCSSSIRLTNPLNELLQSTYRVWTLPFYSDNGLGLNTTTCHCAYTFDETVNNRFCWDNFFCFGNGFVGSVADMDNTPDGYMYRYTYTLSNPNDVDLSITSNYEWVIEYYDYGSAESKTIHILPSQLGSLNGYTYIFPTDILFYTIDKEQLYLTYADESMDIFEWSEYYDDYANGNRAESVMQAVFGDTSPSYYIYRAMTIVNTAYNDYYDNSMFGLFTSGDFFRGAPAENKEISFSYDTESKLISYDLLRENEIEYAQLNAPIDALYVPFEWLAKSVGSFLSIELFPHFALGSVLVIVIAFGLVMWWLKIFGGG